MVHTRRERGAFKQTAHQNDKHVALRRLHDKAMWIIFVSALRRMRGPLRFIITFCEDAHHSIAPETSVWSRRPPRSRKRRHPFSSFDFAFKLIFVLHQLDDELFARDDAFAVALGNTVQDDTGR